MKAMMRIALAAIVLFCMSCYTMNQGIHKNTKFTDKMLSSLLKKNGNVFYLKSTNATFSTVWTYHNGKLVVYNLAKGKISQQQEYSSVGMDSMDQVSGEELLEVSRCMELDGDIFGYRINRGSQVDTQDLPIGIACFTKLNYNSVFLNRVVADINAYRLWYIRYL